MKYEVDFDAIPALGHEIVLPMSGQRYVFTGARPYTRRDGTPSTLLHWRSTCQTCGAAFECKSGMRSASLNRRCDGCKAPSVPARQKGTASDRQKAARQAWGQRMAGYTAEARSVREGKEPLRVVNPFREVELKTLAGKPGLACMAAFNDRTKVSWMRWYVNGEMRLVVTGDVPSPEHKALILAYPGLAELADKELDRLVRADLFA